MASFPGGAQLGGVAQGGVQPCYYVDAAGTQFWGVQTKRGKDYQYVVYRQAPGGTPVVVWSHVGGQGNLCLQPDGRLVAVAFTAVGDAQSIVANTVPGWVLQDMLRSIS